MNKNILLAVVTDKLKKEREEVENQLKITKQAAIDAPGAMQSHSDTTKFQMNSLADTLRQLIKEKEEAIDNLNSFPPDKLNFSSIIQIGSVIEIKEDKNIKYYFILPVGGGIKIKQNNKIITVITPDTPIVAALQGKKKNDKINFEIENIIKEIEIVNII